MRIYEKRLVDVAVDGKLRSVSVLELANLISADHQPAITAQGLKDLKTLQRLLTQIFVEGEWLLQSPWAVASVKMETLPKR